MRQKHLEYVRNQHPEEFQKWIDHRMNHLEKLKQNQPKKFNQFMEKHPEIHKQYQNYQQRPDQRSKQALGSLPAQNHPSFEKSQSISAESGSEKPGLSFPNGFIGNPDRRDKKNGSPTKDFGDDIESSPKKESSRPEKPVHARPLNTPSDEFHPSQRRDLNPPENNDQQQTENSRKEMFSRFQERENSNRLTPEMQGTRAEINRPLNNPGSGARPFINGQGGFEPGRQGGGGNLPQGGPRKRAARR